MPIGASMTVRIIIRQINGKASAKEKIDCDAIDIKKRTIKSIPKIGTSIARASLRKRPTRNAKPVYLRMKEIALTSAKIVVDETRAPVLDPGRGRTKTGYFWAISRDDRPWGGLTHLPWFSAWPRGRARDAIAGGLLRHRSLRRIHGL
jgi:Transposase IS66 family